MIRLLLAALVCLFTATPLLAADRPNIVFILVDDLRFDDLGCTGHPFSKTPNVDRLAAGGLNFTNAFATAPLCSPSRASFLTGLHAHAHGITDNTDRSAASHRLDTWPKRLHEAGYATAYIGKWHMGNDDSPRPGFDRWVSMKGQGDSYDPPLNVDGREVMATGYVTDVLTHHAIEFIREQRDPVKPLLIYLAHKALHPQLQQAADGRPSDPNADNFIPAQRHEKLYEADPLPRRPNYGVPPTDKPALMQPIPGLKPLGRDTVSTDKSIKDRLRMLAAVDESVGAIVDALRAAGRFDDTLIVFTSDHGYFYGEHGLSVERRLAYEEAIRIPLIVHYPKLIATPRRVTNTVTSLDLAPTMLELGHAKPPLPKLHGMSLVPLLRSEPFPADRDVLIEYSSDTVFARAHRMGYKAVRSGNLKYIRYTDLEGADELYDLARDPYELENIIAEQPAAREAMQRRLRDLLESTR